MLGTLGLAADHGHPEAMAMHSRSLMLRLGGWRRKNECLAVSLLTEAACSGSASAAVFAMEQWNDEVLDDTCAFTRPADWPRSPVQAKLRYSKAATCEF